MKRPSILVVDDFPDGLEMLSEYLTFKGFAVTEATNGAEAIEIAKRLTPDVVLMDLEMQALDGWEATRRLRADSQTKGMVVVAVTAHALQAEAERARQAGCDAVIAKPFELAVLANALLHVMQKGPTVFDVPGLSLSALKSRTQQVG